MDIFKETAEYERWLRTQCNVVERGLRQKHKRMAFSSLLFFRATCYRFAYHLPIGQPELAKAPRVFSVGDVHIENFGTWRDKEGRLVWGINDFDEAANLPYTFDLVRLATSVHLAADLSASAAACTTAILEGYREGLEAPAPCFVHEGNAWMVKAVAEASAETKPISHDLAELEDADPKREIRHLLSDRLPKGAIITRFGKWQKGGGSLGRPRFVAEATWQCGPAVREAKALVPSAWDWASGKRTGKHLFKKLAEGRYRSPDPFLDVADGYVVRRIANDATKIELSKATSGAFAPELFHAMGRDLAAIHLGGKDLKETISADFQKRGEAWLKDAAQTEAKQVEQDFKAWRAHQKRDTEAL